MNEQTQTTTKQDRQKWIIIFAVGLFVASIVYSPQRITVEKVDSPFRFGNAPAPTEAKFSYIEYDFIWEARRNSSLDFGRLAVTWLAIGAVAGLALYLNRLSRDTTPPQLKV